MQNLIGDPKVVRLERHHHNRETWFGKSADQSGNDWGADTLTPLQAISGAGVYGADANDEAKMLGSADTPHFAGKVRFDIHRILVVAASVTTIYKLRIVWGTGTMADAITAEQFTEFMLLEDPAVQGGTGRPFEIMSDPDVLAAGMQVWLQCKCATDNATLDFFFGIHEYEV